MIKIKMLSKRGGCMEKSQNSTDYNLLMSLFLKFGVKFKCTCLSIYSKNSLHLSGKDACIFVREKDYLFRELSGTHNVQGQIYEHVF